MVSYKEENFFKRVPIVGSTLLGIVVVVDFIFTIVTQHYLIISIGSTLLLTILQGQSMPSNLILALATTVLFIYFLGLLLDLYVLKRVRHNRGKIMLLAGVAIAFFTFFIFVPVLNAMRVF